MMALCPCLVDTPLSRGAMNVSKDAKFSSEMGMRALEASEVAEAFERLVVAGGTGEALLVYPGLTFYWPHVQYWMFNVYCYAAKFLIMVKKICILILTDRNMQLRVISLPLLNLVNFINLRELLYFVGQVIIKGKLR